MELLHNRLSKDELRAKLEAEDFARITVSFYRYVILENPKALRDELYREWSQLGCLGRIYIAREGINAQMNVPEQNWDTFVEKLHARAAFAGIPFKIAVEENAPSFLKLTIKVKTKIVADGLAEDEYDVTDVGTHLTPEEFNQYLDQPNTVCVDMRNHYESEIGHFEGAITPDADTFREELPLVRDQLKGQENKKVLLYCTGGIRCEKASAYLKHCGFKDVNQLHGGIIQYAHEVRRQGLDCKFKGKNFVFDGRTAERISDEVIAKCHQCGQPADTHTNCANDACHLLFLQCEKCAEQFSHCCCQECQAVAALPIEAQREARRGKKVPDQYLQVYKSRIRPKLCQCE